MTAKTKGSSRGTYIRESVTPMEKLQLDNNRLERNIQLLSNENSTLKETNRKLRLEIISLKSSKQKSEDNYSRSLNRINEMNAAFAEMAQKNRNSEAERDRIDVKRRELIRNRIDDAKQTHRLEKTVNSLTLKCIQHKTSDQEAVNKMTQDEKIIAVQERKIMKLKKENERLKEQLNLATANYNTTSIELKRKETFLGITQHDLNLKIVNQEESLNRTLSQIKKIEKEKETVEEKVIKQARIAQQLEISNKKMIDDVHECNDKLQNEKRTSHEKDLEINRLKKEITSLQSTIAQNNLQFDAYQKKINTLQGVAYKQVQEREQGKATPKFEKLREKFAKLQESNEILEDEIKFLKENNKVIKSQLNSQSANRVNQLLFQNEALRNENANLRNQLDENKLAAKVEEMQEIIDSLQEQLKQVQNES